MRYTKHFVSRVIDELQNLEEIGGPDSYEQYIAVLTAIRLEIDKRIEVATKIMLEEGK